MSEKKIPEIRFHGFGGEWEEKTISDLAIIIGGGTPSTSNPDYWNGGINWFVPTELGDDIYVTKSAKQISKRGIENSSAKLLPAYQTILFTSRASIGKMAILKKPGATNQGFQSLVIKDGVDVYFVFSLGEKIKKKAEIIASGSTFLEISGKSLGNVFIYVSEFEEEQKRIGSLFSALDRLIDRQRRKLEKLQTFKQAMLEKMFPKEGSLVPEIRFRGFQGEWDVRKLGNISTSYSGGTPSVGVKAYYGGNIPFIRSAEINSTSTELFITKQGLENSSAKLVNKGDILYALYGATSGEVGRAKINGAINQAILAIVIDQFNSPNFVTQWFKRSKEIIVKTFLQGGQGNLSAAIVKELMIPAPNLEEQKLIGSFFSTLDRLIESQQLKLSKLQTLKQSLLQKMFV